MASFVVKEWQPPPILKMLIVQTMHLRSYGGKTKNSLLFTLDWSDQLLCSSFLFFLGGVASAMLCRLPVLAFIASSSTI
jgi:hypothetical protein